eukprot:356995-Chlamydomonas_euryale.AAC.17
MLSAPNWSVYSRATLTTSCMLASGLVSKSSFMHSSAHSLDNVPKNSTSAAGSIACVLASTRLMSGRSE